MQTLKKMLHKAERFYKISKYVTLYHLFIISFLIQGKNVDASYAKVERDKRQAKQASEEQDTAKRTVTARLGEQFLLELLEIELAEQREAEEYSLFIVLILMACHYFLYIFQVKESARERRERETGTH